MPAPRLFFPTNDGRNCNRGRIHRSPANIRDRSRNSNRTRGVVHRPHSR
ncbi:MAG: hypothetical protein FWE08_04910 [Oscillospiraceae bacterium]|nr:hypothetical protein [Oscillospiraceae bacterium]